MNTVQTEIGILTLVKDADFTGRIMDFEGQFEMSAPATSNDGNEYEVFWIFDTIIYDDGSEADLDAYDYTVATRIVELL